MMSRVPVELQAVFLASNRGQEVNKPPPGRLANRVFTLRNPRKWFWNRRGKKSKKAKAMEEKTSETATSGTSRPMGDIFVPVSVPSSSSRFIGRGKAPPLKRADSATSSVTFQFNTSQVKKAPKPKDPKLTPQAYLDAMLRVRGYSVGRHEVLKSGYYNKPSSLQQKSYDVHLVTIAKSGNAAKLRSLLAAGISQNPANSFGESLLHMICRLGSAELLKVMIDGGCDIQVADDHGRTPLHDACWAAEPAFDVVEILLDLDPRLLFMMDARGALPLSYVQTQHFEDWINFLHFKKEVFWPPRQSQGTQDPPPLTLQAANTRPVPDPDNALSFELVRMLASGRMSPEEIALLQNDDDDDDEEEEDDNDDESLGSRYSFSSKYSGVSFGGYTFNFSDSDESSSCAEDCNEDDNDDASFETEGVETVIDKVFERLSARPPPLCPPKMSNSNDSGLYTPSLEPVPVSPIQQKYSYTPPQGPRTVPASQIKHMNSLTVLAEHPTLITLNQTKKKKSFSSKESRSRASKDSHSLHSSSSSIHSEISFQAKASKSTGSFGSQLDQGYQAFPNKTMHSSDTLTANAWSTRKDMSNLFCLPEGDDGMLEGCC